MTPGQFVGERPTEGLLAELEALQPENPFATAKFFNASERLGLTTWVLGIRDASGGLKSGCCGLMRVGRLNRSLQIPSLPFARLDSPFWSGLQEFCRAQRITVLSLDSFGSPSGSEIPPLGARFTSTGRQEFVLALGGDLLPRVGSNHKRNIKKSQKAGVSAVRSSSLEAIRVHESLMRLSMDRRRSRGEDVAGGTDDGSRDCAAYVQSGAGEFFQAVREGTVLSSVLVLRSARGAYYQSAGTSPDGMSVGASHFLIYSIAMQLTAEGVTSFNLGGADEGSSLARFKEGFGASRVLLTSATCYVGPRWKRVAARGIELLRHDRATLKRMILGQRTRIVIYAGDSATTPPPDDAPGLAIRPLSADEVRALESSDPDFRARQIERLERFGASYAHAVICDGQIAHVSWLLPPEAMDRDPPHVIRGKPEEAEITACETLPEFRGRGIYPFAIRSLMRLAHTQGTRRVFMKTDFDNVASQSGIEKAGLKRIGVATLIMLPITQRQTIWRRF
jgi:RimJ/RimL family protein N-acetyltransferase